MAPPSDDGVPIVSRVADGLERLVFAPWYRWVVRGLLGVLAALVLVHGVRYATARPVVPGPAGAEALAVVTSAAVTVFVLAGTVQLLLYVRGIRRREGMVAAAAKDVEASAEEVARAAEHLDEAIDDPATGADAAGAVEARVERVEEEASTARETVERVTDELDPPDEFADDR